MFKKMLISLIETLFDEERSKNLLIRFMTMQMIPESLMAQFREFDESKHPRDEAGKFSPTGSLRPQMTKKEAQKWDDTGKKNPKPNRNEELKSLKDEIKKLNQGIETLDGVKGYEKILLMKKELLVKKQRDYAEAVRKWKHSMRSEIESGAAKRIMKRKAKEYHDLEDDIDYIQEKYQGDPFGELKFPKGKRGEKAKADYENKLKKRDELLAEIDWDLIDDE